VTSPLLSTTLPIDFAAIRPEDLRPAFDTLLERAEAALARIGGDVEDPTWESVLGELDEATAPLELASTLVTHLEAVVATPALRAAWEEVQPRVAAFWSRIPLSAPLWQRIRGLAGSPAGAALTGIRRRYLDKTVADFRRAGADLDAAGKQRLEAIDVELAELTTKFVQHVIDATAAFEVIVEDEAALGGLPPSAVAAARQAATQRGRPGWRFGLDAPSVQAVLTYLDDASVRERVWRAMNRRGADTPWDNRGAIVRILELRREKATLLGWRHFADLVLADRMAHDATTALNFLDHLRDATAAAARDEHERLATFAGRELAPWDISYWAEKLRRQTLDFDGEVLRPWFPLPRVLDGIFAIARRLYGVQVVPAPELPVWHADARGFRLLASDGAELGVFYVDLFPRDGKRDGAWMHGIVTGNPAASPPRPHVALVCANLNPAIGDEPALLTHDDVETLFHEFGHLFHHLLSEVDVRALGGTNVAWDFVELPSQIMENWCWERESLDLVAAHWRDGSALPADLLTGLRATRTFRAASAQMRQIGLATLDLELHTGWRPGGEDPIELARRVLEAHGPVPLPSDWAMLASFNHLFASPVGYAAGYYSYKWAEVLDADAFDRFAREGLLSSAVGDAFRTQILARGDSEDPAVLFRNFMGRDPTPDALLRRAGLATPRPPAA
jgi:oligopeptidase A